MGHTMKRKVIEGTPICNGDGLKEDLYRHRLHYHWSNLEADRSGRNIGSPAHPHPKVDRTIRLQGSGKYRRRLLGKSLRRQAHFNLCSDAYRTADYNTFSKNGVLKLTEIELYFLSSRVTRSSCHEWAVVYLGVGNGERFRYLRDDFFPGLTVIAFDPLDVFDESRIEGIEQNARLWNNDGSNFTFLLRCFDVDDDIDWMRERLQGKKLLFISDIRGVNLAEGGTRFDKQYDQEVQWKAIQRLRPERSLVKFTTPDGNEDCYHYAPGVLLKQIFCYYGTTELRLLIDGVPECTTRYDTRELYEKTALHHRHLRGMVYASNRCFDVFRPGCLDCCFDCTVLWNTVSTYAEQNALDPYNVLQQLVKNHIYELSPYSSRWSDFWFYLQNGRLMEACATLEKPGDDDEEVDWRGAMDNVAVQQPDLASLLKAQLPRATSTADLGRIIGSLSKPFTLVRTELNGLLQYPVWSWVRPLDVARRQNAAKMQKQHVEIDTSWYKTGPCWYYSSGQTCFKGDECMFQHGANDVGEKTGKKVAYKICWQYQRGICIFGDNCWWRHEIIDSST